MRKTGERQGKISLVGSGTDEREREKKKKGEREKDEDRTAMRKEREIRAGRN